MALSVFFFFFFRVILYFPFSSPLFIFFFLSSLSRLPSEFVGRGRRGWGSPADEKDFWRCPIIFFSMKRMLSYFVNGLMVASEKQGERDLFQIEC